MNFLSNHCSISYMSKVKLGAIAMLLFAMVGGVSAQSVQVDGLVEEDINTSLGENGVTFETSYLDKTLDYKDVFVPEQYHEHLADFDVNYDRKGNSGNVKFSIDFSFKDVDNSEELPNKLDGYSYSADFKDVGAGNGGQTAWTVQSNIQQVSGNPIQEDADYDLKITGANNNAQVDGSLNRVNDSDQIVNDATIDFNISSEEFAFDTGVFKPKVSSHYEHLIVEHEVRSSVSPQYGEILDIKENVYSGEDTTLLPVEGQINKYDGLNTPENDYVDRMLFRWDRGFEMGEENVTVVMAYPQDKEFLSKDLGGNTYNVSGSEYYSRVESEAESLGREDTLLNSTEGYKIKAFNTTVQGNTTVNLQYKIDSELNESNDLRMWVLGSFAGGSGTSSDPYEIENCSQLNETRTDLDASYELISDIDCSDTSNWNGGSGWIPVGKQVGEEFQGVLNGNGYTIHNLYSYRPNTNDQGFLYGTYFSSKVYDLGINANITGDYSVGILEAESSYEADLRRIKTSGYVKGYRVGGISGVYGGGLHNSYTNATVVGKSGGSAGGIASEVKVADKVLALGSVSTGSNVGGLFGTDYTFENISSSYWDTEATGETDGIGYVEDTSGENDITGLTTSEMTGTNAENNMNFDFGGTWMLGGSGEYPYLCWEKNECNTPPAVDSIDSPSDSSTIDSLSPSLDVSVSDPDGDSMTVEYFLNGSSIGSNSGVIDGSDSLEASGLEWGSDYEWYVTVSDGNGGSTTSSTYQFTTQSRPEISSVEVIRDEASGSTELSLGLDDKGESDIIGYSGLSSAFEFTNSSLKSDVGLPFSSSITVSDIPGAVSPARSVDVSKSISDVRERSEYGHDTSVQRVEKTGTLSSGGDGFDYNWTLTGIEGSIVQGLEFTGSVGAGGSAESDVVAESDWITAESTSTGKSGNSSRSHDLDTQYLLNGTTFHATNERNFTFQDVNISDYCSGVGLKDVAPGENDIACQINEYPGDYLVNEQNYSAEWDSGEVLIASGVDQNFTGVQNIYVENEQPASFQVNMSSMVNAPEACSVSSMVATVDASQAGNSSVSMSCDPGSELDYTPVSKTETSNDIVYTYEASISVASNASSNSDIDYCFPETRADNWGVREPGRYDVTFDGSSEATSVDQRNIDGIEHICLTKSTGSPSLLEGQHSVDFKYYESKDTEQTSGDSGGSTGGVSAGSEEQTVVENVTGEFDWVVSALGTDDRDFSFFGHPGEENTVPIALENTGDRPVNLTLECVGGSQCDTVELSRDRVEFGAEDFTSTVVDVKYSVPQNFTGSDYNFRIRVTDPSYEPGNSQGVAYMDFKVSTENPLLSIAIDRFSRLVSTIPGTPIPFFVLPLVPSMLAFAGIRSVWDEGGAILAGHVGISIVLFLLLLFGIPPL